MPDETPDQEPHPDRRLADLDRRVSNALEKQEAIRTADAQREARAQAARASGAAWRIMVDLVAATLVVAGMGWGIDALTGASPWGLTAGLFLGFAVGMWLAVRRAGAIQRGAAAGMTVGAAQAEPVKDKRDE